MSCTLYIQRPEDRIKVAFGRVLPFDENVTVNGIPLLHVQVKITVDDVVDGYKHVIVPFSINDKE
jgi:hypothetical protein